MIPQNQHTNSFDEYFCTIDKFITGFYFLASLIGTQLAGAVSVALLISINIRRTNAISNHTYCSVKTFPIWKLQIKINWSNWFFYNNEALSCYAHVCVLYISFDVELFFLIRKDCLRPKIPNQSNKTMNFQYQTNATFIKNAKHCSYNVC